MALEFYKHIELESEVEELKLLFEKHNIQYEISSPTSIIDSTFVGHGVFAKYTLKLYNDDFEKVNSLIEALINKKELQIEEYKYLDELSDDELTDILVKPKDWSFESVLAAKHFLKSRNVYFSEADIDAKRQRLYSDLQKGKKASLINQFIYFLSIVLGVYFGIIFIIAGAAMGYYYTYGKDVSPDGKKYFTYDESSRKYGKWILYIGSAAFVIQIILLLYVIS